MLIYPDRASCEATNFNYDFLAFHSIMAHTLSPPHQHPFTLAYHKNQSQMRSFWLDYAKDTKSTHSYS